MTNKLFRLPSRNQTNHSPVFQTYSNTVVQYTSFNVKPTKMLSDPVAEAFGLFHRPPLVKISAVCVGTPQSFDIPAVKVQPWLLEGPEYMTERLRPEVM